MRLPNLPWFVECFAEHPEYRLLAVPLEMGRPTLDQEIVTSTRIWVDLQRGDATDAFTAPTVISRSQKPGAMYPFIRAVGCEAQFHVVSDAVGARRQDHIDALDLIVNNFVWLAYEIAREKRLAFAPLGGGPNLAPSETPGLEQGFTENGARYLLRFTIGVPVVSPQAARVRIGPAPDVVIESTHVVPFNQQDWSAS